MKKGANICPKCQATKSRVPDSRPINGTTRRRRQCKRCKQRWTTYEITSEAYSFLRQQVIALKSAKAISKQVG